MRGTLEGGACSTFASANFLLRNINHANAVRSAKAAAVLAQAGFTNLVDQRAGYDGAPLPTGGVEPGWRPKGLPTSTESAPDRTYDGLKKRG